MSSPFPYRVAPFYLKHVTSLATAASVLLVIVVSWQAAALAWLLVPTPEDARWRPPPVERPAQMPTAVATVANVDALIAAQIFGTYRAQAPAGRVEDAPETRLALELLGVLLDDDARASRALIGAGGDIEKPFAVGDEVARDTRLHAVFADRVILERGGSLETLRLKREVIALDFGQDPQPARSEAATAPAESRPPPPARGANGIASNPARRPARERQKNSGQQNSGPQNRS